MENIKGVRGGKRDRRQGGRWSREEDARMEQERGTRDEAVEKGGG